MEYGIWERFAGSLAFVVLAIAMWGHFSIWYRRLITGHEKFVLGATCSFASCGAALLGVEMPTGGSFDLRFAPLLLAATYGGPVSAVTAGLPSFAFEFLLEGSVARTGILSTLIVSILGSFAYLLPRKWLDPESKRVAHLIVPTVIGGLLLAHIPSVLAHAPLSDLGLPLIVTNSLAVSICGLIMLKTAQVHFERRVLETAFAQSPDYLYVKDRQSRFIAVNDNMARLFRFKSPSEMIGLSDFNLRQPPTAEELYFREQEIMRTAVPIVDAQERLGDRDLLASKVPLRDDDGRVVGLAGVTRDITDRVELERELRQKRNLLAQAMEGMSEGFAIYDKEGVLIFCNEQYRGAYPYSGEARIVGAHITAILRRVVETGEIVGLPVARAEDWIQAAGAAMRVNHDEELQLRNGQWRSVKTRLANDGTAMVVVSDISAAKHAELALRRAADQMQALSKTDGLTNLTNRRGFDEALAEEIQTCIRHRLPLSILMIDVDWFKAYNDTYGHLAGDDCLRVVARCLAQSVKRSTDIVARYGGEEFVVLLPDTQEQGASIVAEEFNRQLALACISHTGSEFGRVTASIGILSATDFSRKTEPAELLGIADTALYEAKKLGRNQAVIKRI